MPYSITNTIVVSDDAEGSFSNVVYTVTGNRNYFSTSSGFQGRTYGYTYAGWIGDFVGVPPQTTTNVIDRFPFATDESASDIGDAVQIRGSLAGHSSSTHGYTSGGVAFLPPPTTPITNAIDRFPFSTPFSRATDIGDLTQIRRDVTGHSSESSGYSSGGLAPLSYSNRIDKFPFAFDLVTSSTVGSLSAVKGSVGGNSSGIAGYTSGGYIPGGVSDTNQIDKFPFSTDTSAKDIGDISSARSSITGQSSTTHGYLSGGNETPLSINVIEKFPFATDSNVSDVGDLTLARQGAAGQSSMTHGYTSGGGVNTDSNILNTIDKFPFSSDASASDVGDLTQARYDCAGQQV